MRITGWHVDAFGALHDVGVADLPPGLVVFHGPNEAGKSTLLSFLQRTLFGHPHRNRQDVNHYEPVAGGCRGGRVHLLATPGDHGDPAPAPPARPPAAVRGVEGPVEVTVARRDGRPVEVRLPDGTVGDQATLDAVVGGADHRLFNAVFAFDLDDLGSIDSLTDEAVRDRLFSAGVRGAGRSARAVTRELDREIRELWTPRTRTARIDQLEEELAAITRELDEAVRAATDHPRRLEEEQRWQQELDTIEGLVVDVEQQERALATLLAAWPTWQQHLATQRELAELAGLPQVGHDALEQHERLAAQQEDGEARMAQLDRERQRLDDALQGLDVDERLLAVGEEVADVAAERGAQLERLDRLEERTAEQREATERLRRAAEALGTGWQHDAPPPLEPSITTRGTLRDWERQLTEARRRSDEARHLARERDRERELAAQQLDEVEADLQALRDAEALPDATAVEHRRERLVQLRVALLQRDAAAAGHGTATRPGGPTWLAPALAVLAVVLAGGGVLAAMRDATGVLGGLVGAALVLLAISAMTRRRPPRRPSHGDSRRDSHPAATIAACARELGLPPDPEMEDVEACALHLESLRGRVQRAEQRAEQRTRAHARLTDAAQAHAAAVRRQVEADAEADAVATRWSDWCERHGLHRDLDPPTVGDLLTEWERIIDGRVQLDALEVEVHRLRASTSRHRERCRELLARVDRPHDSDDRGLLDAVTLLAEEVADATACAAERARLIARRQEVDDAHTAQSDRWSALADERRALLAAAGVDDETGLRDVMERTRRRLALRERQQALEVDLEGRLGEDPEPAARRAELLEGDPAAWQERRRRLRAERHDLAAARDEALEHLLEARRRRQEVETSEQVAELEQRRGALVARRDELVERWAVARLALRLVDDTLETFQRERQPAVLRRAGDHVAQVTEGAYRALLQRDDELLVVDRHGRSRSVDQLSRGTAEQLYLCLRLALAEDLAERGPRLPFVMDDVLVNLDPERSRRLAGLLGTVARGAQVLYFTCHPHLADLLADVAHATVYDLPPGRPPRRRT